jgi:SAM-dependent methyltransferase
VNRIYQLVRKKTLAGKRKLVTKHSGSANGTLLDLGSGVGSFVHEMKTHQWQVTGLEPDPDARKIAAKTYDLELADTGKFYHLPEGEFDAITMWHVLEHVHELHLYLQHINKILKPDGRFFIAVPNYTSFDSQAYREFWAAYDVPRHLYHFSPASMKQLLERNGLEIASYQPMWYDSFYISILSSKYKNGKTKWPSSIWNGLRSNLSAIGDATKCSSVIYIVRKKLKISDPLIG